MPAHLWPYTDLLGQQRALEFFLEFGGATFYLANDPKGGSEIAGFLGLELMSQLIDRLRADRVNPYIRIPTAKPWMANVMVRGGMAISKVARKLHTTDVTVSRWLKDPTCAERRR